MREPAVKTVFFDIDTQIDFLLPAGALYVPGAERMIPALSRLNHFAAAHDIPVVSTMCAHEENDPEFREWPAHCVVGTVGQLKPAATLLERRVVVPPRPAPLNLENAQQILLEKQQLNLFTNPNLRPLLDLLAADAYLVYGVVTEYCVRFAAMGLLDTGKPVAVVTDAIQALSLEAADRTLTEFRNKGGTLTTVAARSQG